MKLQIHHAYWLQTVVAATHSKLFADEPAKGPLKVSTFTVEWIRPSLVRCSQESRSAAPRW